MLWGRPESSSGATVDADSALSLSAIFAGVMLLSRVVGTLPLEVRRKTQQWGRSASVAATSNPAHWILGTEFNPEMTAAIGRRQLDFFRLLWGNAYGRIAWDGAGRAAGIWPVQPWRVRPARDEDGSLYYDLDGERIAPEDMIHVPLVSLDGVTGRSFIDWAFESLGMSISAQEFAGRFFGNDAQPGVTFRHPANLKKQQRDEFRESWNKIHQGPRNARQTAILWGGWDVVPSEMVSPEDAQLLESRRFGIEEVARWLNIPPHLLRDLSRATFSNIEHQGIDFVVYSIGMTLKEYEQEFDRKLLSPPDVYSKHNVNALLRGDHA
jgi:HK97 family phage portal protein